SMLEREDTRTIRNLQRAVIWSAVWRYLSRHECSKMTACVCGRARGHRKRCPLMTYYKVGVAIDTGANLKKAEGELNPPIPRATAKRDQALTEMIYRSGKLRAFDCGLIHLLKWSQNRRVGKMLSEIAEWAGIDPERAEGYECGRRPVC